jgi:Fe-S-cluster-containing dehydrogenase component
MAAGRVETIRKLKAKGIVIAGIKSCLGISQCGIRCQATSPYGAPEVGLEPDAKVKQFHPCHDAWEEGKKPISVEASPHSGFIGTSPLKELGAKHRENGRTQKVKGITV